MSDIDNPLADFTEQRAFAAETKVCERTISRYRAEGLPWLRFGGRVFIGPANEARQWLLKRVRRTDGGA